jgi:biotin operon repressor
LQWQDGRNAAYEKARALIQENGLDHTLYPQANQEDANLFCILRAKQYLASVPMTNQIHFNELVTATQIAIKQVKAEFAEGKRLAEVELHKLKEAGFQITDLGEDGYDLTHPEFEYDPRLHRDLAEIQDFTPKLLAKLEEIREGRAKKEAAKASIDALKSAGFTIQAVAKELRLKHAEMDDQVFLAKQDLSDVHETAQQALVALQSARDKASVTIEEHKENKHLY